MIRVCLRFDDPSLTSNHAIEKLLIAELEQRRLSATFAVVPFHEGPEGRIALDRTTAAHLLEAQRKGVIEIAQHGYSHKPSPYHPPGRPSEFIGYSLTVQETMIEEGRQHLSELFETIIDGFVPPWNSGDEATMAALKALGFRYSSSATPSFPGYHGPICRIPRTCHLDTAERALEEARMFKYLAPIVVIVLHHYDFTDADGHGLARLRAVLDRIVADPLCRVVTLHEAAIASTARYSILAIEHILNRDKAHWRLQRFYPQYCLVQRPLWRVLLRRMLNAAQMKSPRP